MNKILKSLLASVLLLAACGGNKPAATENVDVKDAKELYIFSPE